MKSLFDKTTYDEIITRLEALSPDSKGSWGKMSVGQMVWHCQIPLKVAIKNKKYNSKGNILVRLFFKKALYNDKPWRKNLPTTKFAKARDEKDFTKEREELRMLVKAFYDLRDRKEWNPHPIFGEFTHQQWGQLEYKHLDHHLRQFGV